MIDRRQAVTRVTARFCLPFDKLRIDGSIVLIIKLFLIFALYERKNEKEIKAPLWRRPN